MLRTTAIGFVSIIALGVGLGSPAGAMGGHVGGGPMGGHMGAGSMGGHMGGGAIQGANVGRGGMMAMRTDSSPGRFAQHDMGRMRMGDRDHDRDRHDHDRDRHDHDRFRFFPAFAFGVDTYADVYDPSGDCWELHRIWTHAGWRLRRLWVCN
jgi:hypothetical protein